MSDDVEAEAKSLGWQPKEEFKGDPNRWVDAETYVARGQEIMPILKANNSKLQKDLEAVRAENAELRNTVTANQEAIEALKEFNSEATRRQATLSRKDIIAQIKTAREAGDVDREFELREQLDEVQEALEEAEEEKTEPRNGKEAKASTYDPKPDIDAWKQANPWYGQDEVRTDMYNGIAARMRQDPKNKNLFGRAFLDAVAEETDKRLKSFEPQRDDKAAGGRHSGGDSVTRGRSYADLPADAKAACDRQGTRLIGPGRAYKTQAEWRAAYCERYDWS